MSITSKNRVAFSIRGNLFETYDGTLFRFPDTLLGDKRKLTLHYCSKTNQYLFDRDHSCFESILYFYQSNGTLRCPIGTPFNDFEVECEYFHLPQDIINQMKIKEGIYLGSDSEESFENISTVWKILDKPKSSLQAWIFGLFSLLVVWLSLVVDSLDTMPMFASQSKLLATLELAFNIWFFAEVILRSIFSPSKFEFLQNTMNLIDIVVVVPYFLLLIVGRKCHGMNLLFNIVKCLRIIRMFRLARYWRRLQAVGCILKYSSFNFRLISLCVVMAVVGGGTFSYVIENCRGTFLHLYIRGEHASSCNPQHAFTSIPQSMWWAVQTITSVGYGDLVPVTLPGKLFAAVFMVFGAKTVSLPVMILVSQFTDWYPKNAKCNAYYNQYQRLANKISFNRQYIRRYNYRTESLAWTRANR